MGVAEHKRRKNEACSRGIVERYAVGDYVDAQVDAEAKIVAVPEAGRRRARAHAVDQPDRHRLLQGAAGADDAQRGRRLAAPARARDVGRGRAACSRGPRSTAGAPDGCLQVVEEPTIPLIEALMADRGVDVIVATGGTAVVRAAYRSGNPALGVGPGNVPALVDATADVAQAAACLADSKAFDNSILCTNESVAIVEERVADAFERELGAQRRARARRGGGAARPRGALSRRADRHGAGRQGRRGARGGRGDPGAGAGRACSSPRSR